MSPVEREMIRRKLAAIVENLKALEPIARMTREQYLEDLYKRKATERLLQELIEAALISILISLSKQVKPSPMTITKALSKRVLCKLFHQTSRRSWLRPRAFGIDWFTNITDLSIQRFWMPSEKLRTSTRST